MKKSYSRRIAALFLAFVIAMGTLASGTVTVNAASAKWTLWVPKPVWTGTRYMVSVQDINSEYYREATVTSVKSSNPKVLKVVKEKYDDGSTAFLLKGKKNGKAKVTVKFTKPSGKTGSITKTFTVKKYPYEIKSLTINGKKVKLSENKFFIYKKISKETVKIKMSLKKGWKITSIYAERSKDGGDPKQFTVKKSDLLNGKAIEFAKKYKNLYINVQMQKGNDNIYYSLAFHR